MPEVIITTPRLNLRLWRDEDTSQFITMNKDPEVMRFFPAIQTDEETIGLVSRIKEHFTQYGYGAYAVERKDNGQFIGFTGFSHPLWKSYFTPCIEIAWRLEKNSWGQGFATEAATACLQHGFTKLGLTEVYSFTATINHPSINVMRKTGMEYMGQFEHPKVPDGHRLKTHVLYKIIRNAIQSSS